MMLAVLLAWAGAGGTGWTAAAADAAPSAEATDRPGAAGATAAPASTTPSTPLPFPGRPAFPHRGFYFHCGWTFDYPFAPHSWARADFRQAFQLLRALGFDTVMYWPQIEAIPAPISAEDRAALTNVRDIVSDARAAGLRCWLTLTPNLISPPAIAVQPFSQRNPFRTYQVVRLDRPEERDPYLAHRQAMLRVVNNADAYVTIDGDPGGYPGAQPEDFLRVFAADRATLNQWGRDPARQAVVPWFWAGWGRTEPLWKGDLTPFARASMALLKERLPEPWLLLPGRSFDQGWANGRVNVALAEELGLLRRSTILCYEAVEFEPCPPAATLQFDAIRRILKEESARASQAYGVMANAQQPIMVLPNIYFFARGAWDPAYLDRPEVEVLGDFAAFLGGPPELLVPAWRCLKLSLEQMPNDLPQRLRGSRLTGEAAAFIPGGPQRYLEILAAQVTSRIELLTALDGPALNDNDCARRLADAAAALVNWWRVHHYVQDRDRTEPFAWRFVRDDQVAFLRSYAKRHTKDKPAVTQAAAALLTSRNTLPAPAAASVVAGLYE